MIGNSIKANGIDLWYETFGDSKNPAILLLMGNSCDAIMWPEPFCNDLAQKGYYVIRFDQRDTGESTWFEFNKTPYTLCDMATDAVELLNALTITKAHIIGFSTGGTIAQLITIHHPSKVLSLTLMMPSMDLTIKNDAFAGKDIRNASFPPPKKEFIHAILALNSQPTNTRHEKILQLVQNFKLANGNKAPFDEHFFYTLFEKSIKRTENKTKTKTQIGNASNHALATSATQPVSKKELATITLPTLIIAGGQDPLFPLAHSEAMTNIIPNAQLLIIDKMGHILTPIFFNQVITAITEHLMKVKRTC